jgi:hypothetical protein
VVVGDAWELGEPGVLDLPSGRRLRGRGLRRSVPADPLPEFGLCLLGAEPPAVAWPVRWVDWPDSALPRERDDAVEALRDAWRRARTQRVEIACSGGRGRTGTALACIAILDGIPAQDAVAFVREHYDPRAVETPWQRRYVARFLQK